MDINYYKQFEPIDGKWYISKEIGSGAFGTVFEIERKDFADMKAALKVISIPSSQSEVESYKEENYDLDEKSVTSYFYGFVEEFVKEFRLMSQLKGHSNIVSYEDHDVKQREDGIGWDIFIRMELLTPMNKYFANNAPKKSDIIKLGIDICKALEVCQKYNIIHRDIKPSNIFVSSAGDFKLGDFGVARTLEKTSSGLSKKGTYTYMAPEVFKGEKYGSNVDIYSLGIVMYKLLNNNLEPFRTDRTYSNGEKAMEQRISGAQIPKPQNADGRLAEIVLKACSYDPKDRYESPLQMREELENILYNTAEGNIIFPTGDRVNYEPSTNGSTPVAPIADEQEEKTESMFASTVEQDEKTESMFASTVGQDSYVKEETVSETVGIFGNTVGNVSAHNYSEQEVVKIAFAHSPKDFNSAEGRAEISNAWTKIIPNYSSVIRLSANLVSNKPDDIKNRISNVDTDSLLVAVKSLAYHMGNGDDKQILGPVQKFIIETLTKRDLSGMQPEQKASSVNSAVHTNDKIKEESVESKPKNNKNAIVDFIKNKWKLIAIIAAALLALIIGICVVSNLGGGDMDGFSIELYTTETCDNADLKEIEKTVKARAKKIDSSAKTKIGDNKITLYIDDQKLGDDPIVRKQRLNWIKTKGDVLIYCNVNYTESNFGKEAYEEINLVEFSKDDIKTNEKYFTEIDYNNLMNSNAETFNVLEVQIDDGAKIYYNQMLDAVKANFDKYDSYGTDLKYNYTSLQLTMDKKEFESATVVGTVIPDESNNKFYIVSPAAFDATTIELMKFVLEEESEMKSGLSAKVNAVPQWESDESKFGENQVASLDGKNVVIKFTPADYYVDGYNDENISEYVNLIKKRFDTFGSPYAVGYTGIDYKTILIKMPPSSLIANSCSMAMQGKSIVVNNQYKRLDTTVKSVEVVDKEKIIVTMDGDKNKVATEYNKTDHEIMSESLDDLNAMFEEDASTTPQETTEASEPTVQSGTLYLLVNDITIAQADLSEMTEDGKIEFKNFLCFENQYCMPEEEYLLKLIEQINSETYEDSQKVLKGSLDVVLYDGDTELKDEKIEWMYDSTNDFDKQIIRTIEKMGYKVEKSPISRSTLNIRIDVDINDDLADKFTKAVKEIYTACNFDEGSYSWVFFMIDGETDNHPDDRCRLVASKGSYGKLAVTFADVIDGPSFEKYIPDFDKILGEDEFFSTRLDN